MGRPLLVFGTRPEAIKLAPVVRAFEVRGVEPRVCVTAQHRQMLDQVLEAFGIKPHHDLNLMRANQTLAGFSADCLRALDPVLEAEKPDAVVVQGDTTTVLMAALAAFYRGIPVAHVEAGLRTGDLRQPFPEEGNRVLADGLASFLFAPTDRARSNLLAEGKPDARIWVTGNTAVDALLWMASKVAGASIPPGVPDRLARSLAAWTSDGSRLILVTGHRRESFGRGFEQITLALHRIATKNPADRIVYPVHLNPNVREPVQRVLGAVPNVHLIDPLPYPAFVWLLQRAHLVLTDSGGIQEEAPGIGKPVLVLREKTERPEAVEAGTSRLVGVDADTIVNETQRLLDDPSAHRVMAQARNPFGDGRAAERIVDVLLEHP